MRRYSVIEFMNSSDLLAVTLRIMLVSDMQSLLPFKTDTHLPRTLDSG